MVYINRHWSQDIDEESHATPNNGGNLLFMSWFLLISISKYSDYKGISIPICAIELQQMDDIRSMFPIYIYIFHRALFFVIILLVLEDQCDRFTHILHIFQMHNLQT